MTSTRNSLLLIGLVILLAVVPLFLTPGSEFGGADGQAEPWFQSIWEPPSGEIESLLFALQAALGAGFIGYYCGYKKGNAKVRGK
jgi:cobalt/nickel transport protein